MVNATTGPIRRPYWRFWRYQPVFVAMPWGEPQAVIIEVYLDADDKLVVWTESLGMTPRGDTPDELQRDLCMMLAATQKWQPVAYADLRHGMTFEPRDTTGTANDR